MEHWFFLKELLLLNIYCFFSSVKKCRALLYGTQSYIRINRIHGSTVNRTVFLLSGWNVPYKEGMKAMKIFNY
jgi:hypothetical protein